MAVKSVSEVSGSRQAVRVRREESAGVSAV